MAGGCTVQGLCRSRRIAKQLWPGSDGISTIEDQNAITSDLIGRRLPDLGVLREMRSVCLKIDRDFSDAAAKRGGGSVAALECFTSARRQIDAVPLLSDCMRGRQRSVPDSNLPSGRGRDERHTTPTQRHRTDTRHFATASRPHVRRITHASHIYTARARARNKKRPARRALVLTLALSLGARARTICRPLPPLASVRACSIAAAADAAPCSHSTPTRSESTPRNWRPRRETTQFYVLLYTGWPRCVPRSHTH